MDFLMGWTTCIPLFVPNVSFIFLLPSFFSPIPNSLLSIGFSSQSALKTLPTSSNFYPYYFKTGFVHGPCILPGSSLISYSYCHCIFPLCSWFRIHWTLKAPCSSKHPGSVPVEPPPLLVHMRKEATTLATTFKASGNPNEGKTAFTQMFHKTHCINVAITRKNNARN